MNRPIEFIALFVVLSYLGLAAFGPIVSNDVFWHLKTGQDWLENGLSPLVDHYSFTYAGNTIEQAPWLFQAMTYGYVSAFGDPLGLKLIRVTFFSVFALWFFTFLRAREASTWVVVFGLVWIALALPSRMHVRPEIISLVFAPFLISLAIKCRECLNLRYLAFMFAIQLAWINVHTSYVFGIVIIGALLIDRLIHFSLFEKDYRTAAYMIALGLLLLGLTFINLDLESAFVSYLLNGSGNTKLVQEYGAVDFNRQAALFRAFWVIAAAGVAFALINRSWMTVIIVLALGFQAWTARRFSVPFVYISLPLLLLETIRFRFPMRASLRHTMFLCMVGVTAWCMVRFVPSTVKLAGKSLEGRHPIGVVARMKSERLFGNTLADYSTGGYVLQKLAPNVRVFIDGRLNILYPPDFFEFYYQLRQGLEPFNRAHELYPIQQILTTSNWRLGYRLIQTAVRSRRYSVAYDDGAYSLLRQRAGNFAFSSDVHADPRCWNTRQINSISNERALTEVRQLPGNSLIVGFLKFAQDYDDSNDPGAFFQKPENWWNRNSIVARLAIYLTTMGGLYEQSMPFFNPLLRWNDPHDRLYLIHSLIRLGKPDEAVGFFANTVNVPVEPKDLMEMYYALGMELFELGMLPENERQLLEAQKSELSLVGYATFLDVITQTPDFCKQ